jgi:HSP20 family protein
MAKNTRSKRKNGGTGSKQQSLERTDKRGSDIARREPQVAGTPFTFMRRFSEEMDRLFEDFGFGRGWIAPGFERSLDALTGGTWMPQVEVIERDNQLIVRADLPGMTKDDISVDVEGNSLVIRGERKTERQENEEGYYRSERSYGTFYRQIPLPSGVNAEEARADFRNGVLEISMPSPRKTEEMRRSLEISGESERQPAKAKSASQK